MTVEGPTGSHPAWKETRVEPTVRAVGVAGEIVGGYTLLRRLGAGGMGEVWLGQHETHGRQAAVKLVLREAYGDAAPDRIAHEFRQLCDLRHPNVVSVLDTGVHDNGKGWSLPYVVMDHVPGATALTQYARERRLDVRARIELFLQACEAVACVHDHGHIHLDLKPDNILVDRAGRVCLTDFGLARPVLGWIPARVAGTPGFMAPEHLAAEAGRLDKRTDVWALGAVLYWLVAGTDPHGLDPSTPSRVRLDTVRRPPRTLAHAAPDIRTDAAELLPALETIVAKAMAPNPDDRYASADALRRAVRDALDARGFRWAAATLRRTRPRTWRTLRGGLTVVAATVAAVLVTAPALARWETLRAWLGPASAPALASASGPPALPDVRIVGFDTATARTLAGAEGLADFRPTAGNRRSLRPMHAALILRLAEAGVRVIVFDVFFTSASSEHDAGLVAAIRAARTRGTSVVLGVRSWRNEGGRPELSPTLWEAGVAWGGVTVGSDSEHFWATLLVAREGVAPMPSLSAAAFAKFHAPERHSEFTWIDGRLRVRPFRVTPGRSERIYDGADRWIEPTDRRTFTPDPRSGPAAGFVAGDREWYAVFDLPPDAVLDEATIRYESLWAMPVAELSRRFARTVVVVADLEFDPPVAGTTTPSHRVHAAAVQSLIRETGLSRSDWPTFGLTMLGAGVGVGVGGRLRPRRPRSAAPTGRRLRGARIAGALLVGAAGAALVLLPVAWLTHVAAGVWLYPLPGLVAAGLGGGAAVLQDASTGGGERVARV